MLLHCIFSACALSELTQPASLLPCKLRARTLHYLPTYLRTASPPAWIGRIYRALPLPTYLPAAFGCFAVPPAGACCLPTAHCHHCAAPKKRAARVLPPLPPHRLRAPRRAPHRAAARFTSSLRLPSRTACKRAAWRRTATAARCRACTAHLSLPCMPHHLRAPARTPTTTAMPCPTLFATFPYGAYRSTRTCAPLARRRAALPLLLHSPGMAAALLHHHHPAHCHTLHTTLYFTHCHTHCTHFGHRHTTPSLSFHLYNMYHCRCHACLHNCTYHFACTWARCTCAASMLVCLPSLLYSSAMCLPCHCLTLIQKTPSLPTRYPTSFVWRTLPQGVAAAIRKCGELLFTSLTVYKRCSSAGSALLVPVPMRNVEREG